MEQFTHMFIRKRSLPMKNANDTNRSARSAGETANHKGSNGVAQAVPASPLCRT
jgi:hypothetical protein